MLANEMGFITPFKTFDEYLPENPLVKANDEYAKAGKTPAVSYTHLDVYKRQLFWLFFYQNTMEGHLFIISSVKKTITNILAGWIREKLLIRHLL